MPDESTMRGEKMCELFMKVAALADKRALEICRRMDRSVLSLVAEGYLQALFDLAEAQRDEHKQPPSHRGDGASVSD